MKQVFKNYIEKLKNNGFKVYINKNKSNSNYCYFEDENGNVGYCQLDDLGSFSFTSVHRPNPKTGTGFRIASEVNNPTIQNAKDCFIITPYWARRDRNTVKKYKNFGEYRKLNTVLKYTEV